MKMTEEKIINILRNAIPKMKCKITCNDCCGPIPFSKWEWEQIKDKKYSIDGIICPYISSAGCKIYNDRPIICRIFGCADIDILKCPHGYKPKNMLSKDKADQIKKIYHKVIFKDPENIRQLFKIYPKINRP